MVKDEEFTEEGRRAKDCGQKKSSSGRRMEARGHGHSASHCPPLSTREGSATSLLPARVRSRRVKIMVRCVSLEESGFDPAGTKETEMSDL